VRRRTRQLIRLRGEAVRFVDQIVACDRTITSPPRHTQVGVALWRISQLLPACSHQLTSANWTEPGLAVFCKCTHRSLVIVAMILPAASLSACSQASAHAPATVRGLAAGCQNPFEKALQPITVVAMHHGHTVKKTAARFSDFRSRYQLVLRPGHYTISDPMSGAPPRAVTLRPGNTITLDLALRESYARAIAAPPNT
jgi:hypothetical protein